MTWVPTRHSIVEGDSLAQLALMAEQEKWHLSVTSTAGCLATPPDDNQLHNHLSNVPFGLLSEEWEEATQPRADVHSSATWEGMNGGFEHTRLHSSACFSDGNNARIFDGLDMDNKKSNLPKNWAEREWGEVLKGLPERERTDGGFREYAGQRRRSDWS